MSRRLRGVCPWLVCLCFGSCDREPDPEPLDCSAEVLSPCEVNACHACVDLDGAFFWILESSPPQYQCANREGIPLSGYFGYDYCRLPYCEETASTVSREEVTAAGISAAAVLEPAEGEHVRTLEWLPTAQTIDIDMVIEPRGTTQLEMSVEVIGEPRFVSREKVVHETDGVPDIIAGVHCQPSIEADILLRLRTADEGLDESVEATLMQWLPSPDGWDYWGSGEPSIQTSLSRLQGSLSFMPVDEDHIIEGGIGLQVVFTEHGPTGELFVTVRHEPAGGTWVGFVEVVLARW